MGGLNRYTVEWYNPINGQLEGVTETRSGLLGALELEYPYLTADDTHPFLLFKMYRKTDGSFSRENEETPNILMQDMGSTQIKNDKNTMPTIKLEAEAVTDINIYPNPTSSKTTVELPHYNENTNWEIKNIHGKLLYTGKVNRHIFELDLSYLPSGIYIFTLHNNDVSLTKKLIKR
jgi:hypothetical protein